MQENSGNDHKIISKGTHLIQPHILTDNAVYNVSEDLLEFRVFAETLDELISKSRTPLTIGLFGEWGSGKTSLMQMTRELVEKGSNAKAVWFDAWKFDRLNDLRVALIQVILTEIEKDKSVRDKVKSKTVDLIKRINWFGLGKMAVSWAGSFINPGMALLPALINLLPKNEDGTIDLSKLKAEDILQKEGEQKTIELIGQLESEFKNIVQEYVGKNGRLVIFIDDLDRCIPEKTIDVLEAIKLFLNVPQTIFVIGADKQVVVQGIQEKYGDKSEEWGRNYLEKIIQLPFRLPPLNRNIVTTSFLQSLEVTDVIKKHADIVAEVGMNPRNLKRLINTVELHRILSIKRGIEIDENVLVKLTVLEFRWPDFYTDLVSLLNERDFNLIEFLVELSASKEEEKKKQLGQWEQGEKYLSDKYLMKFIESKPFLHGVDLEKYLSLTNTSLPSNDDSKKYFRIGSNYSRIGEYEKAIEFFNKAIEIEPEKALYYHKRGKTYFHKGYGYKANHPTKAIDEFTLAIDDFTTAIKFESQTISFYIDRGDAFRHRGQINKFVEDLDNAKKDYSKAIELDPTHIEAYFVRAYNYGNYEAVNYEAQISDYTNAINLGPTRTFAHNNRGLAYQSTGQYIKAFNDFMSEIILGENVSFEIATSNLANLLREIRLKKSEDIEFLRIDEVENRVKNVLLHEKYRNAVLIELEKLKGN